MPRLSRLFAAAVLVGMIVNVSAQAPRPAPHRIDGLERRGDHMKLDDNTSGKFAMEMTPACRVFD